MALRSGQARNSRRVDALKKTNEKKITKKLNDIKLAEKKKKKVEKKKTMAKKGKPPNIEVKAKAVKVTPAIVRKAQILPKLLKKATSSTVNLRNAQPADVVDCRANYILPKQSQHLLYPRKKLKIKKQPKKLVRQVTRTKDNKQVQKLVSTCLNQGLACPAVSDVNNPVLEFLSGSKYKKNHLSWCAPLVVDDNLALLCSGVGSSNTSSSLDAAVLMSVEGDWSKERTKREIISIQHGLEDFYQLFELNDYLTGMKNIMSTLEEKADEKLALEKHKNTFKLPLGEKTTYQVINYAFEKVLQDDRSMYRFSHAQAAVVQKKGAGDIIQKLEKSEFSRSLTYGEVFPQSITNVVIPFLQIGDQDVFYDLGCGTGKIVAQVAMQTLCRAAKGIELMPERAEEGLQMLNVLQESEILKPISDKISLFEGDICDPPEGADLRDATVVFINNVCFGPELMIHVCNLFERMTRVRRLVTLRKICERHSDLKCKNQNSYCMKFQHPPKEEIVNVTWAEQTTAFCYIHVDHTKTQV